MQALFCRSKVGSVRNNFELSKDILLIYIIAGTDPINNPIRVFTYLALILITIQILLNLTRIKASVQEISSKLDLDNTMNIKSVSNYRKALISEKTMEYLNKVANKRAIEWSKDVKIISSGCTFDYYEIRKKWEFQIQNYYYSKIKDECIIVYRGSMNSESFQEGKARHKEIKKTKAINIKYPRWKKMILEVLDKFATKFTANIFLSFHEGSINLRYEQGKLSYNKDFDITRNSKLKLRS